MAVLPGSATPVRHTGRIQSALPAVMLLAVIPNLALRAAEFATRGTATIVNIEFFAIALVAPFIGVRLTVLALAIAIAADATTFIAPVFHFELEAIVPSLAELARARTFVLLLVAVAIAAALWTVARTLARATALDPLRDWRVQGSLVGAAVFLILADAANGSGNAISTRRAFLPLNIAGAPTLQLSSAIARPLLEARRPDRAVVPVASATSALFRDVAGQPPGRVGATNVGLVIVESMGQLLDHRADSALFSALLDTAIAARYQVRRGTVRFDGPTTGGEFRELCGELRTYRTAPETLLSTCLPVRLRALGYATVALHGFRRGLFDRKTWYPFIGIDSIIDDAAIRAAGEVPDCGTIFRGPCDRAVAPIFTRLLSTPTGSHRLVYWLTLSAHFPVDSRAAEGSSFDCSVSPNLAADGSACMLARIWSANLASVRATALSPAIPATRFVIVGDHSPPLPSARQRRLFSPGIVPYVELIPRPTSSVGAASTRNGVAVHDR